MWQKLQTLPNQQTHRGKILYWHIRDGAVWHQHRKIRRADPATLEVFQTDGGSGFIARDKNHVYHAWTTLKNIDRASFEHIAAYLWRDKNHVYAEHETSPAMPAMFTATGTRSPKPTPQAGGICTTAFPKNSATSITVHASSPTKTPPIGTRNAPRLPMPCVSCGTSPKPKQTIRQPENRRFQQS